ncbi:TonB-linked SusC/RagA family outer membrane protein [Pontibacter aydingkolensis]|uniref:SusC/RagA family TonB-linked outer membrane protein n=1 Tax=Pontibacter aydingkolensis TaxID=1911536 RepID=A0ABS7CYC3_9BACT|nr:SusC/RagA family TonB-linked outer membrane protein [Pontibacter aydingkolensis]MBW7468854.1 SusC/RagA family TonB-linked outer membrane protein [Pontibacter aydingkolensis]
MKRILLLSFLLLTAMVNQVVAQVRTITGKVTDATSSQPLPGVTVVAKGTSVGTATSSDGTYSISVPAGSNTLVFRFIGYKTIEKAIGTTNTVNAQLALDQQQLEEVVVTALGFKEDKDKQGAATSQVTGAKIAQSGETSAVTGLSGKASGVQITRSSGDPGAGAYIQIRGQSTITSSVQPLIIIDGIPVSNSNIGSGVGGVVQQSRLNDINPNDIASVQILKGASAAALWGSRAANGVMVITTKSGSSAKGKINISYGLTYSLDQISYTHDLQETYGQGFSGKYSPTSAFSYGDKISERAGGADEVNTTGQKFVAQDGTEYYPIVTKNSRETFGDSNFDAIFQNGHFLENNLSFSGGDQDGNFFLSLSNLDQEGIIKNNSDYNRTTARLNAEKRLASTVNAKANITYSKIGSNRIQQGSNTSGLYLGFLRNAPDFDIRDYKGTYFNSNGDAFLGRQRSYRRYLGNTASPVYNNPLWTINDQRNTSDVNRFIGSFELSYEPLTWLNFIARGGVDNYTDQRLTFFPVNSAENGGGGEGTEQTLGETQLNGDFIARANKSFGEDFTGSFLVGLNLNQRTFNSIGATYRNFILNQRISDFANATNENTSPFDSESTIRTSAGYATATFGFKDMLYLNASGRLENASTFGSQTKSVFFYPSADVAFQFSDLAPFADSKILSFGKLRAGYGEVGVQPGPYLTVTDWAPAFFGESWGPGLDAGAYDGAFVRDNIKGNAELKPERKKEFEVGTDLRFFDNRFSLNATYYTNETVDAIFNLPQPASSGYTSLTANAATLENKGIELDFDGAIIRNNDFSWNIGGNWTRNRNKVTDLQGVESIFLAGFTGVSSRAVEGQPVGVLWGGRWERNENGGLALDSFGFPINAQTEGVIGDPNPDWRGGLNTRIAYKGFSLFTLFEFSQGGDIWAGTEGVLRYFGTSEYTAVETTLSAQEAAETFLYSGKTVAEAYTPNADGSYTFRGRIDNFGGNNVALDQSWYTSLGGGFGPNGEQFIQDASWTRIREMTLSYTLNSDWFRNATKFRSVELSLTGRNLAIWSKEFKGVDPETNLTGTGNGRGLEYFNNPGTRSYLASIRFNF